MKLHTLKASNMNISVTFIALMLQHFVSGQLNYILGKLGDELRQLRLSLKGPSVQSTSLDKGKEICSQLALIHISILVSDIEEYDFIVVGAGSAGAVLASRLSENPNHKVLLLEAGTSETIINQIPYTGLTLFASQYAWTYKSTPQAHSCFGKTNLMY